jgi:hypothetical protein
VVELSEESYHLLVRESERRGMAPDALANELVQHELATPVKGVDEALSALAKFRESLPRIDGLALARAARDEFERRVA